MPGFINGERTYFVTIIIIIIACMWIGIYYVEGQKKKRGFVTMSKRSKWFYECRSPTNIKNSSRRLNIFNLVDVNCRLFVRWLICSGAQEQRQITNFDIKFDIKLKCNNFLVLVKVISDTAEFTTLEFNIYSVYSWRDNYGIGIKRTYHLYEVK